MDYEKLVQGRRRNWDALKPEEVRRREKEEEKQRRAEELEKAGKKPNVSRTEAYRLKKEEEQAKDVAAFERAKRHGLMLVGGCFAAFMLLICIQQVVGFLRVRAWNSRVVEYSRELAEGKIIQDVKDPVGAFATWRSAWLKGDMKAAVDMFSTRQMRIFSDTNDRARLAGDQQILFDRGVLQSQADFAGYFDYPEIVRIPSRPWRNDDLAIFLSPPVVRVGDPPDGVRFIVAFSYSNTTQRWYFAEGREAQYFNINWKNEAQIPPLKAGPNARRYELDGTEIK